MWENEGFKCFQDFMALFWWVIISSILLRGLGPRDESDWGRSWFSTHTPFSIISGSERHREAKISTLARSQKQTSPAGVVWLPSLKQSLVIYRSSTAAAAAAAGIFQFSLQSIQSIDARDSTSPAGLLAIRPSGNRFLPSLDDEFLVFVIRVSALVVVKKLCEFLAIDGMPLLDILLRSTQDSAY